MSPILTVSAEKLIQHDFVFAGSDGAAGEARSTSDFVPDLRTPGAKTANTNFYEWRDKRSGGAVLRSVKLSMRSDSTTERDNAFAGEGWKKNGRLWFAEAMRVLRA